MKITRKTIENDMDYLRQISQDVDFNDNDYKKDINLLKQFGQQTKCFALAAIQIGIPRRIIYLKNTSLNIPIDNINYDEAKILINPVIISRKGCTKYWEACLSCLDNMGLVYRPYEIVLEYYDSDANKHQENFEGFESTVLSHELDHLDGILHMDIAETVLKMTLDKRKEFRKSHPYEVISKTCEYENNIINS